MTDQPSSILDDPGIKALLLALCRAVSQFVGWVSAYYKKERKP